MGPFELFVSKDYRNQVNVGMEDIKIYGQWHVKDMSFVGGRSG
jgi:hypothetical protein